MRQTGYYFVNFLDGKPEIAYYSERLKIKPWQCVSVPYHYRETDFVEISEQPITPEKMAAIDAIIDTINKHKENRSLDWAGIEIIGILSEHKLI